MQKNLDRLGGLVHSQRVLLALTQAGISREDSYRLVQRNAMKVWGGEGDFLELLKADPEIAGKVPDDKLAACFSSEERRVGKECSSTCRSRGWQSHSKKKQDSTQHI